MLEAVGERYWPTYFHAVRRALRPSGRFGLQAITMPHDRMLAARHAHGWIHKYVFPGGLIPSLEAISEHAGRAGLAVTDGRSLGADYAVTLRVWRERFTQNSDQIDQLGFDEVFRRVWEFYLAYSEAGFRSGHLDTWQLRLEGTAR
jgi:cyclopropane-fatty-acyl-phospholipid synthase